MSDYSKKMDKNEYRKSLSQRRIHPQKLKDFCVEVMVGSGMSLEDSKISAEALVTTDAWGIHTHGTKQLRFLIDNIKNGQLNPKAQPRVLKEGPSWALMDGQYAMPMVSACKSMKLAITKAKKSGIAYVGVCKSSHFAGAGYYANLAAEENMIGLSMCNTDPCVTVPGGSGAIIGTNPVAYAVPAGRQRAILLDIATSTVSASKVHAAKATNSKIPGDWLVDDEGMPTTDPNMFPDHGALAPMTAHKGFGIALLVEILSAAVTGAAMLGQVKSWVFSKDPADEGHAFIAIDVGSIMPLEQFKQRVDWLIDTIKGSPRAKGAKEIRIPGEKAWKMYEQANAEGMSLPEGVLEHLLLLAEDRGLRFDDYLI